MPTVPSRDDTSSARTSEPNDGARVETRGGSHASRPWWETKTLEELTPTEWEALCDGCGRCCLVKLEDEDSGEILHTDIGCKLFDAGTCRCSDYPRRHRKVADCIALDPAQVRALRWLPGTCAYRLVAEGNSLRDWHPLVSGSPESVHEAGISVRGRIGGNERQVKLRDYVDHIIVWDELSPSP